MNPLNPLPPAPPTFNTALIANGPFGGCVLAYVGRDLDWDIREGGVSDLANLGLDDAPDEISIWEGHYVYFRDTGYEGVDEGWSFRPVGAFRPPTDEEWTAIREGRSPFEEEETQP